MSFAKNLISHLRKLEEEGRLQILSTVVSYKPVLVDPKKLEKLDHGLSITVGKEGELLDSIVFNAEKVHVDLIHPTLEDSILSVDIYRNKRVDVDINFLGAMGMDFLREVGLIETPREVESTKGYLEKLRRIKEDLSNVIRDAGYREFEVHLPSEKTVRCYLQLVRSQRK